MFDFSLKDALNAADETREYVAAQPPPEVEPQFPKEVHFALKMISIEIYLAYASSDIPYEFHCLSSFTWMSLLL